MTRPNGYRSPLVVTDHAIERYRERVEDIPDECVIARLTGPLFDLAARMGGRAVILPSGHRVVCSSVAVVTVLPQGRKCLSKPGYAGSDRDDQRPPASHPRPRPDILAQAWALSCDAGRSRDRG